MISGSFTDRDGGEIHPPVRLKSAPVEDRVDLAEGEDLFAQLAFNIGGITFQRERPCLIELIVDGESLHAQKLAVALARSPTNPPE